MPKRKAQKPLATVDINWQEFTADPENIKAARDYWRSPAGLRAKGLLIALRPRGLGRGESMTPEAALAFTGRLSGYEDALSVLDAMTESPAESVNIPVTWTDEPADETPNS